MTDTEIHHEKIISSLVIDLQDDIRPACEERWRKWRHDYLQELRSRRSKQNRAGMRSLEPESLQDPCFFFWSMHNTFESVFPELHRLGPGHAARFIGLRNKAAHREPISDQELKFAFDFATNARRVLLGEGGSVTVTPLPRRPPPPPRVLKASPVGNPGKTEETRPEPVDVPSGPAGDKPGTSASAFRPDLNTFHVMCDRSYSMLGEPITSLNEQLRRMLSILSQQPSVDAKCRISISSFSTSAESIVPLSRPSDISAMPSIDSSGVTNYGRAFRHLADIIERSRVEFDQSYRLLRPVVFFLTDGAPTDDDWSHDFEVLTSLQNPNPPLVVFCPLCEIGQEVPQVLNGLTGIVEPIITVTTDTDLASAVTERLKSIVNSVIGTVVNGDGESFTSPA